jgi:hypothetical protein
MLGTIDVHGSIVEHHSRSLFTEEWDTSDPTDLLIVFFTCFVLSIDVARLHVHLLLAERPDSVSLSINKNEQPQEYWGVGGWLVGWGCMIPTTVPSYLEKQNTPSMLTLPHLLLSNRYRQIIENFKLSSAGEMPQGTGSCRTFDF